MDIPALPRRPLRGIYTAQPYRSLSHAPHFGLGGGETPKEVFSRDDLNLIHRAIGRATSYAQGPLFPDEESKRRVAQRLNGILGERGHQELALKVLRFLNAGGDMAYFSRAVAEMQDQEPLAAPDTGNEAEEEF